MLKKFSTKYNIVQETQLLSMELYTSVAEKNIKTAIQRMKNIKTPQTFANEL